MARRSVEEIVADSEVVLKSIEDFRQRMNSNEPFTAEEFWQVFRPLFDLQVEFEVAFSSGLIVGSNRAVLDQVRKTTRDTYVEAIEKSLERSRRGY